MARLVSFPNASSVDAMIRRAIRERRVMSFGLHGCVRRAEPHDYGLIHGVVKLFFYQIGGESRSGRPVGWRWAVVTEMADVEVLDDRFAGSRDTASGRHIQWDTLWASVSVPV